MGRKSRGPRARTRQKLQQREVVTPNKFLQKFEIGDYVAIDICPSSHNFPHPRFHGRVARVIGRRGRAYVLELDDFGKKKTLIVKPEHLKRIGIER